MLNRLKFLFFGPTWCYSVEGVGQAREKYHIFRDEVRVRTSQFGYVNGHAIVSRTQFEKDCAAYEARKA